LLHIVSDDHLGVIVLQALHKALYLARGDGVEGAARLIEQDDVRLHGQGAGNTKPLLLSSGQAQSRLIQPLAYLFPEGGVLEAILHYLIDIPLAVNSGTIGHVIINRHGKRIGLLEYHAYTLSEFHHIYILAIDVDIIIEDLTLDPDIGNQVVHAIEAADKCGLAAAGGADQSCNLVFGNFQAYILQSLLFPVPEIHIPGDYLGCQHRSS